jgi:hypothetical protein
MAHRELRSRVLPLVLLATVILAAITYGQGSPPPPSSSGEGQQIGKILSVRKVLENRYFVSRYPQIHYYLFILQFAFPTEQSSANHKGACSCIGRQFCAGSLAGTLTRSKS